MTGGKTIRFFGNVIIEREVELAEPITSTL
jgi:hypothetical protein